MSVASGNATPQRDYQEAIRTLNSLISNAVILADVKARKDIQRHNLEETERFLNQAGVQLSDLDSLGVVHVTGTKGKGSTCALVETLLRSSGLRTGFYSSPHLVHARERIRLNGQPISESLFARHFFELYDRLAAANSSTVKDLPAYFKFLTLLAIQIFKQEKVDVAIMEVGIGGEYDCTNVVRRPIVSVITQLDLDHVSLLGGTIPEIAWHKAGIMKPGVPCIALRPVESPEAERVFVDRANEIGASLHFSPPLRAYHFDGTLSGIAGKHQETNASLALQAAAVFLQSKGPHDKAPKDFTSPGEPFTVPENWHAALRSATWRGRSQTLQLDERIRAFVDGAHTPKSIDCCVDWFEQSSATRNDSTSPKRALIFHCTADRHPAQLLPRLASANFDLALFCPPVVRRENDEDEKRLSATNFSGRPTDEQIDKCRAELLEWQRLCGAEGLVVSSVDEALEIVRDRFHDTLQSGSLDVLVTGSLHLVGALLAVVEPNE